MSHNLRNRSLNGSREPGQIFLRPSDRKCIGMWQVPANNLDANVSVGRAMPMGDTTEAPSIWQYTPLAVPVSIAAVHLYYVAAVNSAGTAYFRLVKNGGVGSSNYVGLSPSSTGQRLIFERGQFMSYLETDYWWILYTTTSNWSPGAAMISFSFWIYDGIS